MKAIKKLVALALAAVVSVTAFAGCGGDSQENSSGDSGTLKFGCFNYSDSLDPSAMAPPV